MADKSPDLNDLLLFPHCDLHIALTGAPQLTLRAVRRMVNVNPDPAHPGRYLLVPVPFSLLRFSFFAPNNNAGNRFDGVPTAHQGADPNTALITATVPGVYLFSVQFAAQPVLYMVGRLQVHNSIVDWWFGNDSITTARDTIGHAQPSIYARFSDDPADRTAGTDLIGDITGHGYVGLTSSDATKFTVTPEGRLLGVNETLEPANPDDPNDPNRLPRVSGTFPFLNKTADIPVRVIDYAKTRADLKVVDAPGFAQAADRHNIVFLPEGFRKEDEPLFDQVVQRTVDEMFSKPRHQPYGLLKKSFNVFKYFIPSEQQALTCGNRVIDTPGELFQNGKPFPPVGAPFPLEVGPFADGHYTVDALVARVGLPRRGENREPGDLRAEWATKSLPLGFDVNLADDIVVKAWRDQRSTGLLQARDTFFGLHFGRRLADRASGAGVVLPPAQDTPSPQLSAYIARLYEFYQPQGEPIRSIRNDPRRHPPDVYATADHTNPGNMLNRFFGGLQYTVTDVSDGGGVTTRVFPIGAEWAPDEAHFQRSRGLVALVALEDYHCGRSINNFSTTAQSVNGKLVVPFTYDNPQDPRVMKRDLGVIPVDFGDVVNKVTHEFGHNFNLLDENEDFPRANDSDPAGPGATDLDADNVTIRGHIRSSAPGAPPDQFDMNQVKWLTLPRMLLSSRLAAASQPVPGGIRILIDPNDVGQWVQARAEVPDLLVSLRNFSIPAPPNKQLPLTGQLLQALSITGDIDEAAGAVTLAGAAIPNPPTTFDPGSVLFVPLGNNDGVPLVATDQHVLAHLNSTHHPLNPDKNKAEAKDQNEDPEHVDGYLICKSFRTIGLYEGAVHFTTGRYRPAGACKMRDSGGKDESGEFCFVCKWLIVNRVDPGMHRFLTAKFFPTAKTSEDG